MDNVGNRTTVTNGTTTNYTTNNLNQYTAINGTNPTYDLNGNMTNDGYNTSIVYDYTNHPVRFDNADYTVEMRYDALGRRIEKKATKKTDGATEIEGYVLDGDRVISDMVSDGLPVKQYIWGNGIDELLVTAKGRSREYDFYLNNSLGSITHIANDKAEVQESYKYEVYGTVLILDKKGDVINKSKEKNRYMFTGREWEPETKLYYYRARYYKAHIGRFLSHDSLNYTDSMVLYTYVTNNPLRFYDPFGYLVMEHHVTSLDKVKEMMDKMQSIKDPGGKLKELYTPSYTMAAYSLIHIKDDTKRQAIYTCKCGWIDMMHFAAAATQAKLQYEEILEKMKNEFDKRNQDYPIDINTQARKKAYDETLKWGENIEKEQEAEKKNKAVQNSAYSYEDLVSNRYGAKFGAEILSNGQNAQLSLSNLFANFIEGNCGTVVPENIAPKEELIEWNKNLIKNRTYDPILSEDCKVKEYCEKNPLNPYK